MRMTPSAGAYKATPVTKTTTKTCVTVKAPECELTTACKFNITHVNATKSLNISQSISYTYGKWCDVNVLTYFYQYNLNE